MSAQSYFQLLNPLLFSVFAAAFLALSLVSAKARAAAFLSASYALGAGAFTIDFFRNAMPEIVGAFGSNALYTATSATAVIGFCLRYDRAPPYRVLGAAAGLGMAFYAWLFFTFEGIAARTLGINIVNGVLLSIGVVAVAHRIPARILDRVAFGCLALLALQCFVRPALVFVVDRPTTVETYTQSTFFLTLHLVVGVVGVGLALTLLAAFAVETFQDHARRSSVDALTGVLNRRGFEEAAAPLLAAADATGAGVAVVVADLDRFKDVNEG
ncbi:MAG: diguanylate cyclase, partial [Parvularculaceae bacterium]|nr:diguanylate cyclase [Parvularculaceae bacterium]